MQDQLLPSAGPFLAVSSALQPHQVCALYTCPTRGISAHAAYKSPAQAQELALCLDSGIPGEVHRALNTLSALTSDPVTPLLLQAHTLVVLPPLLRLLRGVDDAPLEGYVYVQGPSLLPAPSPLVRHGGVFIYETHNRF